MDLRNIGLLYYLAAACTTVSDALEYLKRYAATTTDEIRLEILPQEQETVVIFRRVAAFDEPPRQHAELIALAFIRVLWSLTNRTFAPSRIVFAHGRDSGVREVHRILRCPIDFAQNADTWVLPTSVLRLPVMSEDHRLLQILEAHAEELLAKSDHRTGLRGMVENRLLSLLPSGRVQATVIANHLGMTVRTLSRRLAQEDTSFAAVLEDLRERLAFRYLQNQRITLQQVAWLLGYSEVGAFNHAFKRWTGTSPGRARASRTYHARC
jgi:AraC-like DNA-binding protein